MSQSGFEICVPCRHIGLKGRGYQFLEITAGNLISHKYQLSVHVAITASLHYHPV